MKRSRRWRVLDRDNYTCQYCGRSAPAVALEVDHIEPRSWGGSDGIENLITSCWDCNQGKKAQDSLDGLVGKDWIASLRREVQELEEVIAHIRWQARMLDYIVARYAAEHELDEGYVIDWLTSEVDA